MRRSVVALLSAFMLGVASTPMACAEVTFDPDGEPSGISGGTVTDAASGDALVPQSAPGAVVSADAAPLTPGNTWTTLYTDYFGAPQPAAGGGFTGGRAACSGTPLNCHAAPGDTGAQMSGGYVCTGEATDAGKDDCYASLTSLGLLTAGQPFMQDGLYGVLRSVDNLTGLMPAGPPAAYMTVYPYGYSFSAVDVARLSAWVAAGFLDN